MAVAKSYSLSRILTLPRVVFLGASLSDRALLNANGDAAALQNAQDRLNALGFTGTISSRAVSGSVAANLLVQLEAEVSARGVKDFRDTLFVVDFGGNDVTNNRPYDNGEYAALRATLEALRIRLTELRAHWFVLPISRRNYPTGAVVTQDGPDTDGSKPYNDNVLIPWMQQHTAKLMRGGTPLLDMYNLVRLHPGFLSSDGVHWYPDQQRQFAFAVLQLLAEYLKGTRGERLNGKSFGIDFCTVASANTTPQTYTASSGLIWNRMNRGTVSMVDLQGRPLPGLRASQNSFSTTGTSGTPAASARIADPRFVDTGTLLSIFSNISGADSFSIDLSGFTPGQVMSIKLAASRDIADATRKTAFSINGTTLVLDAANNAASNMLHFPSVAADADGHVRITGVLDAASASTNGYLSALIVDVAA